MVSLSIRIRPVSFAAGHCRAAHVWSRTRTPWRLGPLFLSAFLLLGCTSTHKLPKLLPISLDRYPPASRRQGEEGRVLIEFQLDDHRNVLAPRITQSDGVVRLDLAALRLIEKLPFDPADHRKPRSSVTYRVTVIFCLEPGHCERLPPFADTESILVKTTKPPEPDIIFD